MTACRLPRHALEARATGRLRTGDEGVRWASSVTRRTIQGKGMGGFICCVSVISRYSVRTLTVPPAFRPLGKLIRMDELDACSIPAVMLGFRITDDPDDPWTTRFNRVKERDPAAVAAAARTLALAFQTIRIDGRVVVVGAISSGDTVLSSDAPVHVIGKAIAQRKGWLWCPELLSKAVHRSIHGLSPASARDAEVMGKYQCRQIPGEAGTVLVFDDFCTRGATLQEIARAVTATNPDWQVKGAMIAKTERIGYWGEGNLSNNHIDGSLDDEWLRQPEE